MALEVASDAKYNFIEHCCDSLRFVVIGSLIERIRTCFDPRASPHGFTVINLQAILVDLLESLVFVRITMNLGRNCMTRKL